MKAKSITIAIGTLGCKLNQYESHSLQSIFISSGYNITGISHPADVYIINTCTVTSRSDAKSRKLLAKVHRTNPKALIIATGCYAQTDYELLSSIPYVDYVIGNDKKNCIPQILGDYFQYKPLNLKEYQGNIFGYPSPIKGPHTRAYLKIQDGCNRYCSYCKIPAARGLPVSRPVKDIIEQAAHLIENRFKELVLTGINIGDYYFTHNNRNYRLSDLSLELLNLPGDFRLHLSSIEPDNIDKGLFNIMNHPKMVKHIHLPLQSGSTAILNKMERKYTLENYIQAAHLWKTANPSINMTTDLIIGFPTETERDFQQSLEVINQLRFSHIHTFRYSEREGTKAAELFPKVEEKEKDRRSLAIRDLSSRLNSQYRQSFLGKKVRILIEHKRDEKTGSGLSDHYLRYSITQNKVPLGSFIEGKVNSLEMAEYLQQSENNQLYTLG